MKVYEFNLFHNEEEALSIKRLEASRWIDELHVCEASRTFRGAPRPQSGLRDDDFVKVHRFDGGRFHSEYAWGPSRYFPYFRRKDMARKNETLQRNAVHDVLDPLADDIVVLADVDEIVDSRHADEIISEARRHGVVSVRLRHTFFFLNLFSKRFHAAWPGSPPDYAYRVFVMTGDYFNRMRRSSDRLRRLGEWNRLGEEITLLDGYRGFHHSWLGDEYAAMAKLGAYAHRAEEHDPGLIDPATGEYGLDRVAQAIREGRSLFPGDELERRPLEPANALSSVAEDPARYDHLVMAA